MPTNNIVFVSPRSVNNADVANALEADSAFLQAIKDYLSSNVSTFVPNSAIATAVSSYIVAHPADFKGADGISVNLADVISGLETFITNNANLFKGETGAVGASGSAGADGGSPSIDYSQVVSAVESFLSANASLFKGETGATGATGATGSAGANGISPTINYSQIISDVETFMTNNANLFKGNKGDKGDTGSAGADGVSPSIDYSQLVSSIQSWLSEPTQVALFKGEQGDVITYVPELDVITNAAIDNRIETYMSSNPISAGLPSVYWYASKTFSSVSAGLNLDDYSKSLICVGTGSNVVSSEPSSSYIHRNNENNIGVFVIPSAGKYKITVASHIYGNGTEGTVSIVATKRAGALWDYNGYLLGQKNYTILVGASATAPTTSVDTFFIDIVSADVGKGLDVQLWSSSHANGNMKCPKYSVAVEKAA